jgi:hypothetical protein
MHLKQISILYFFKKACYLKPIMIIYLQNNQETIKLNQKNQQKIQIKKEINLDILSVLIDMN